LKKSRFTEEQIVGVLKESEAGMPTAELCRKRGISEQTFYRWKAKYGGMSVSEAQRRKLKQMVAVGWIACSRRRGSRGDAELGRCWSGRCGGEEATYERFNPDHLELSPH
jgi:transposase